LTKIALGSGFATDVSVSPAGGYIAYIRDQDLFAYKLARHQEKALTHDGNGPIKNGMAEFVAQEEMGGTTGYWWSPDGGHIAFARVDETPIEITQRFEIGADNVATFAQRYPAAGGANALVRLGVISINSGATRRIDLGFETDIYLAGVNRLPDGNTVAVQRQSRDQRRLDLLFADIRTGKSRVVLAESSNTWLELNDEITFLTKSAEFVWASQRDGFTHLYLYGIDGRPIRCLTAGNWNVDDFRGRAIKSVDEVHRTIYFTASAKTPIERQFYRTSLDTADPGNIERISQEDGVHRIGMSPNCKFYVDLSTISYNRRRWLFAPPMAILLAIFWRTGWMSGTQMPAKLATIRFRNSAR
jgi:dipeptidyl-peptidase 4